MIPSAWQHAAAGNSGGQEVAIPGEDRLGVYNGIILHEDARVTQGYNPSTLAAIPTVRRAVFGGAQAGMIGFGRDNSINKFTWVEELFDSYAANDNGNIAVLLAA